MAAAAEKIEDSNLANYGSKEHKDLRAAAADLENAWDGAGDSAGIQIWRIEKFKVKPWPLNMYGKFYTGDSFIVLHTIVDPHGKKSFNVHFWLGNETTQDESGTAAYKTVELDDKLKDVPVQYREVEGHESELFRRLFPHITILAGGVESGFHHVERPDYKPRLMHITGKGSKVRVYQVRLDVGSLNNGDTFVLDVGAKVYQFNGAKAGVWEKRQGNAIVDNLQNDRGTDVITTGIIDGLADSAAAAADFWEYFGGKPDTLPARTPKDESGARAPQVELTLHRISNADGALTMTEVGRGMLYRSLLDTKDAFVVDAGKQVYVWIGEGANAHERREAFPRADEYLRQMERSNKTVTTVRVPEGKETEQFWECFAGDSPPNIGCNCIIM